MITSGLMKSEAAAAERDKDRAAQIAEAATRLDPPFPYATLPFPEGLGAMDPNPAEL